MPITGLNPFNPAGLSLPVKMRDSAVADLSGRYVAAGQLGSLTLTQPAATVSIMSGHSSGQPNAWSFETRLFLGQTDVQTPVLSAKFLPPGASAWLELATADRQSWKFEVSAPSALAPFGAGTYRYQITLSDNGSTQTHEMAYTHGVDAHGSAISPPAARPQITSPSTGATVVPTNVQLHWTPPSDPAVTLVWCAIRDLWTGLDIYTAAFAPTNATTGPIALPAGLACRADVNFCAGTSYTTETNKWTSCKLLYTGATVDFKTQAAAGAASLAIQMVQREPGRVVLIFASSSTTATYQVETTASLSPGTWSVVSEASVILSNDTYTARCPLPASTSAFYRIRVAP